MRKELIKITKHFFKKKNINQDSQKGLKFE